MLVGLLGENGMWGEVDKGGGNGGLVVVMVEMVIVMMMVKLRKQ